MTEINLQDHGIHNVAYELQNGVYVPEQTILKGLQSPETSRETYIKGLHDLNETFDRAIDEETGTAVEVAALNLHVLDRENPNVVLFTATDFSCLTVNIGNAIELAGIGSANPNTCYIYVGFPGVGLSSDFTGADRSRYASKGRLTTGNIEAGVDTYGSTKHMEAMWRAVTGHFGVTPEHFSADRSGGRTSLGMQAAAGNVQDGYLNGMKGLASDASFSDLKMLQGHVASRAHRKLDPDYIPGRVNGKTKREAKAILTNIYASDEHDKEWRDSYVRAMKVPGGNFWLNRRALSGHDNLDNLSDHAVFNDVMAVIMKHETMLTLQANVGEGDKAERSLESVIRFGHEIMNHIPPDRRSESRGVEFIVGKGDVIDPQTNDPMSRLSAERRALKGIAVFMRLVFSGKPDRMLVTFEEVAAEAA